MSLQPSKNVLDVKGSIAYSLNNHSWNTIRLKKEIIDEFMQLKDKRMRVSYRMIFYRDPVELFLAVEKMMDANDELPILLYFKQKWQETQN